MQNFCHKMHLLANSSLACNYQQRLTCIIMQPELNRKNNAFFISDKSPIPPVPETAMTI